MDSAAIVLLSGGLDSTVALHLAARECGQVHALAFAYGQRHSRELECARWQAQRAGVASFKLVQLDATLWGDNSLTHHDAPIEPGDMTRSETPTSYVPARNMIFLAIAASHAESIGASAIYLGVSEADYSGYVDCRESFVRAMEAAINQGTERKLTHGQPIRLVAPFLHMRKADEVRLGLELGVDFSHTWTCYEGDTTPCGHCDSCLLRQRAFQEAGSPDPLLG